MMGELGIYSLKPDDSRLLEGMPDPYWAFGFRKLKPAWNADIHVYRPGSGTTDVLQLQDSEEDWRELLLDTAGGGSLQVFRVDSQIGGAYLLFGGGTNVDTFRYLVRDGEVVEGLAKRPGFHPYETFGSCVLNTSFDSNFFQKLFDNGFRHLAVGELAPIAGVTESSPETGVFSSFRMPASMETVDDAWVGSLLIEHSDSLSDRKYGYGERNDATVPNGQKKGYRNSALGYETLGAVCINGKRGFGDNDVKVNGKPGTLYFNGYTGSRGVFRVCSTTSGDFRQRVFPGMFYEYIGYESGVLTDEQARLIHNRQQAYFKSKPAL